MNDHRDYLVYRKVNRIAAAQVAGVSILLLIVVILSIIQNDQIRTLSRRMEGLQAELQQVRAQLPQAVTSGEHDIPIEIETQPRLADAGFETQTSEAEPASTLFDRLTVLAKQEDRDVAEVAAALAELEGIQDVEAALPAVGLADAAQLSVWIGDYESAIKWGLLGMQRGAPQPQCAATLTRAYHAIGDRQNALLYAKQATGGSDADPTLLLVKGEIELAEGEFEEAEKTLADALTHPSVAADAAALLGRRLISQGELARAQAVLGQGEAASPGRRDLQRLRASLLLAQGRNKECLDLAGKLVREDQGDALMIETLGLALLRSANPTDAVTVSRALINLRPDEATGYELLGMALLAQLKPDEAAKQFEKAVKLDPDSASAWYHRGVASNNQGDCESALDAFDRSITLEADQAGVHFARALCLARMGRMTEAEDALVRALSLDATLVEQAGQVKSFGGFLMKNPRAGASRRGG